jgi:VanZ family protein
MWKNLFLLFIGIILLLVALVALGVMPTLYSLVYDYPGVDKVAHVLAYGTLTYFVNLSTYPRSIKIFNRTFLLGTVMMVGFVTFAEFTQWFIPRRSFDLIDLMYSYIGVAFSAWLFDRFKIRKIPFVDFETEIANNKRYYDIDWLRVLGMLTIFLFHNARFFNENDWHVKNFELNFGMSVFVGILEHFIMPLFFVLSAFSIYYALEHRTRGQFMQERVKRLLVPLGVGIFTHIILQVYIEHITHGRFRGTFWQFIPRYFNGWYGFGGNFAWMGLHLWYLLMLLRWFNNM